VVPIKSGSVTVWATVGVVWLVIAVQAKIRWVTSEAEFSPAPLIGPDMMPTPNLVGLRIFEGLCAVVIAALVWFCVVRPWRRTGALSLDGKFVIAGFFAVIADTFLNAYDYLFAWNANNINRGSWAAFMPLHNPASPTRFAEDLMWAPGMYVFFCAGIAILGCKLYLWLRSRFTAWSTVGLLAAVFVADFEFDFVMENSVIRLTHAYAYAQTYGPLTLWAGSQFQFPIYESFLVAALSLLFTWARLQALEAADGLSPVERGHQCWHRVLQPGVRLLAVIGFCAAAVLLVYHLPLSWFNMMGAAMADLPTYMWPG
jgi:Spirocyclase AveC-like